TLGIVEERVVLLKRVLEVIALYGSNRDIWSDAAAAVDCASAVSEFHFAVNVVGRLGAVAVVIVIVERHVAVVALDKPSAGSIVTRRSKRQASVFRQRI